MQYLEWFNHEVIYPMRKLLASVSHMIKSNPDKELKEATKKQYVETLEEFIKEVLE